MWATVGHLRTRGALDRPMGIHPGELFAFLVMHFAVYSPLLFLALAWAVIASWRRARQQFKGVYLLWFGIPVFAFYDGLLQCTYDRNQSMWSKEEGIVFTREQIAAMDYLDELMGRREYQLHMEMRKGDVQFVNNYTVMHARTEYRNSAEKIRHLVRYWIEPANGKRRGFTTRDLYTRESEYATEA